MDIFKEMKKDIKKHVIPQMIFNDIFRETLDRISIETVFKNRQSEDKYKRKVKSIYDLLKDDENGVLLSATLLINVVYNQTDEVTLKQFSDTFKETVNQSSGVEVG